MIPSLEYFIRTIHNGFYRRQTGLLLVLLVLTFAFLNPGTVFAQETIPVSINFDDFTGTGFDPNPAAGQLDSDAWSVTGFSDGDVAFGGTGATGDFARGSSTGGETIGGIYAFDTGSGNTILGVQPIGADFTPGTITLKTQNTTGSSINSVRFSYDIFYFNDEDRSNSLNFSYSTDGSTFTPVSALDFTTPEAADGTPEWESTDRATTINVTLANNDFFYLRWTGDDVGGSGSRDEYGIDNIKLYEPVAIRVVKYNDDDEDGTNNEVNTSSSGGPSGATLIGWEFTVYDSQGDQVAQGTTSEENPSAPNDLGIRVSFTDLDPNETYTIVETPQNGWVNSEPGNSSAADPENLGRPAKTINASGVNNFAILYFGNYEDVSSPVAAAGEDQEICAGSSVEIGGSPTASGGASPYTYSWSPSTGLDDATAANPTASPTSTTQYIVTVTDDNSQTAKDTVIVTVNSGPTVDAGPDQNISSGGQVQIGGSPTASGGTAPYTYAWTPAGSLDDATAANPTASPSATTQYIVTVTDDKGCSGKDTVTVNVSININELVQAKVKNAEWNSSTNQLIFDVAFKNISGSAISSVYARIDELDPAPPTITVNNADNNETGLGAIFDYADELGSDDVLSPSETSGYKTWIFDDPTAVNFTFFANIFGSTSGQTVAVRNRAGTGTLKRSQATENGLAFYVNTKTGEAGLALSLDELQQKLLPQEFSLAQNYPNPFNPETRISYELPDATHVKLSIYNLKGQEIRTLVDAEKSAGSHEIVWNARDDFGKPVASGMYIFKMVAGDFSQVRTLTLVR